MFELPPALAYLASFRQFIVFRLVPSPTRPGKTDKFPVHPESGIKYDAHDPSIWLDVTTAATIAEAMGPGHGVGFVLTAASRLWFLDIDDCAVGDGTWKPHALALLSRFPGAAVEISSSGTGLHIIGSGTCPPNHKTRYGEWFEFYTEYRFVALTGTAAMGDASTDHTAAITQLVADYLTRDPNEGFADWTTGPRADWRGNTDDDELIARALGSRGGAAAALGYRATFRELWEADAEALAKYWPETNPAKGRLYNASKADAALAQALAFWTGNDCERIDRLMRRSALKRDKWDIHSTYMNITIRNAVGRQYDVLTDKEAEPPAVTAVAAAESPSVTLVEGKTFLSIADQVQHFKGCVYIMPQNRALIPGGDLIKPESFRVMYGGYNYIMDDRNERTTRDAWEAFTQNQAFRRPVATDICFRPECPPAAIIMEAGRALANCWWPIQTPCVPGDPGPFVRHLEKLFPDIRDRELITSYLAAIVQFPGVKFQWAPLIQGVEGNGKTLIITSIVRAVGSVYSHLPNVNDLADSGAKFTAWLRNKLFLGFEEVRTHDKRDMIEILKPLITNNRIEIQGKGQDQITGDNRANIIACSNHKDAIPKTSKDRRWAIFYTAQQTEQDLERDGMGGNYMPDLWDWCEGRGRFAGYNGFAIVHHFLKTYPIKEDYNPATKLHRAPITTSTGEAIELSQGTIEQEVLECIEQGLPGFADGWISSIMFDRLLERLKLGRRIPPRKRHTLLEGMGYQWHPALNQGRSPITVSPDGSRPRLFVKKGSILNNITDPRQAAKKYENSQQEASAAKANFGT